LAHWPYGKAQLVKAKERWQELSEQAAKEQDPVRLQELVQEINRLLDEKDQRQKSKNPSMGY
jgi:hypothetical protein